MKSHLLLLSNAIKQVFCTQAQNKCTHMIVNAHPSECQANEMFKNENSSWAEITQRTEEDGRRAQAQKMRV